MTVFNLKWSKYRQDPANLANVTVKLIEILDAMDGYVGGRIWVHCLYDPDRHTSNYHRRGMAADLHIVREHPLDQFLIATRFPFGGIGVYGPDVWNNPGLHVDIRNQSPAARWARRQVGDEFLYVPLNKIYITDLLWMVENEEPQTPSD